MAAWLGSWPPLRFKDAAMHYVTNDVSTQGHNMAKTMWHTTYTRYQALEIIRQTAFEAESEQGESFSDCHDTAEHIYKFYLKGSNKVLEGQLEDIFGERPTVTDF